MRPVIKKTSWNKYVNQSINKHFENWKYLLFENVKGVSMWKRHLNNNLLLNILQLISNLKMCYKIRMFAVGIPVYPVLAFTFNNLQTYESSNLIHHVRLSRDCDAFKIFLPDMIDSDI